MSLQDCEIKSEYRSLIDNVAKDFYVPLLQEATSIRGIFIALPFQLDSSAIIKLSAVPFARNSSIDFPYRERYCKPPKERPMLCTDVRIPTDLPQ